ncbi:MAG: hypothetical protein COZ65_02615 [Caldiserica bacterium CG_4_8_14_3_um_filter_35_18]|nr:MAG: hypothetical protein COZ65_02615 [Caldiserica bacterium CG_4_8_14_3_um_filter_35_18]
MNTICRLPDSVLLSYFASLSKILSSREDFFARLVLLEKAALKFDTEEIKSLLKEIISEHKV